MLVAVMCDLEFENRSIGKFEIASKRKFSCFKIF